MASLSWINYLALGQKACLSTKLLWTKQSCKPFWLFSIRYPAVTCVYPSWWRSTTLCIIDMLCTTMESGCSNCQTWHKMQRCLWYRRKYNWECSQGTGASIVKMWRLPPTTCTIRPSLCTPAVLDASHAITRPPVDSATPLPSRWKLLVHANSITLRLL